MLKSETGKYFSKQLFYDEWIKLQIEQRVTKPIFTLCRDKPGYVNFGRVYVEEADPTGYKVAQRLLNGDYNHWVVLMGCRWFIAAKELWDRELDAKLSSEGLDEIRILAKDGLPAQKLAASKYLANKEYRKDKTTSKGRPKREDIDRAARELADNERALADDLQRIRGIK